MFELKVPISSSKNEILNIGINRISVLKIFLLLIKVNKTALKVRNKIFVQNQETEENLS